MGPTSAQTATEELLSLLPPYAPSPAAWHDSPLPWSTEN
jgi:hypothetical protein